MMKEYSEKEFMEFLKHYYFYYGQARYSQFNGWHIIGACNGYECEYREAFNNLDSHDQEALDASSYLSKEVEDGNIFIASDDNPVLAMIKLVDKIREYYINYF